MEYIDILKHHTKYGTTEADILNRSGYHNIIETVVIAPWWDVSIFANNNQITKLNDGLYLVENKDYRFNFIELKAVGAPVIIDTVMHLGATKCKNIIFIGSAGSLSENISIGDIVIPNYSICGEGASRYLNSNLQDNFGLECYPNQEIMDTLLKITTKVNIEQVIKVIPNYTVDSIFLQFAHIDYIKSLGAQTIEMETSAMFKAAEATGIKAVAILAISDNSVTKAGLYSGRSETDKDRRALAKHKIIPNLVETLVKELM